MAANSAQQSAPVIVSTPASAQATSNHPGEPTSRDDSAETIKIPDPIIDPTTIMVASSRLSSRTSLGEVSLLIWSSGYSGPRRRVSRENACLTLLDALT